MLHSFYSDVRAQTLQQRKQQKRAERNAEQRQRFWATHKLQDSLLVAGKACRLHIDDKLHAALESGQGLLEIGGTHVRTAGAEGAGK